MTEPYFLIGMILVVILISGMIQGALGFGYAIAALTTLPFLMKPQEAHIVLSLSGIPVMAMAAWTSRTGTDWKIVRQAILGGLIALPLGILTFGYLSADGLIRGTGIAIFTLMITELIGASYVREQRSRPALAFGAGLISGYLAGAVSIGGPPIVAYTLRQPWTALQAKAFMTRCLLFISISKGIGLAAGNFLTVATGLQSLAAIPIAVVGVWWGAQWSRKLPTTQYRRIVAMILLVISSWWIIRGAG